MRTNSDILNITEPTTRQPEESNWLWNGGWLGIIVIVIVLVVTCRSSSRDIVERMKNKLRNCSCCRNTVSCDCSVCKSGARRCWRTIARAFSRCTDRNSTTRHSSAEAPPTIAVSRLSIVIVDHRIDPPPSLTLPPSYDSIITNPSEPPPSYEEAVR